MTGYVYVGQELELFLGAQNWKSYWLGILGQYVRGNVADVGAGIGATLIAGHQTLSFDSWTAIEPDKKLYENLLINIRKLEGVTEKKIVAIHGTISDVYEEFDTILYVDVIEHIENDKYELEQAAKRLSSKGIVLTVTPAHNYLFSEFDKHVGHYRRYDADMLEGLKPEGLILKRSLYLDSVGMALSAANRYLLKSSLPSKKQIEFWDHWIVPISRMIDPLLGFKLGKTIIGVWEKG